MSMRKGFALCVFLLYINENSKYSSKNNGKNKERHSSYFKESHRVDSCEFLELKHHTMIGSSKILDPCEAEGVFLYRTYDNLIIFTSNFFMTRKNYYEDYVWR